MWSIDEEMFSSFYIFRMPSASSTSQGTCAVKSVLQARSKKNSSVINISEG